MSEEKNAEQEPSIEEILDSIRQIISDDDDGGDAPADEISAPEPPPAPEPEPEEDIEEDIIELTDKIEEPKPAPEPEEKPIEVDLQESEVPPAPPPPPKSKPKLSKPAAPADDGQLLTNNAEAAAYEGFAELARKTAIEHNGITVEEIVRTELRPLLRDWLDNNLPPIIERLVQEELERVAKRAMED